jgi:hypothetical protein
VVNTLTKTFSPQDPQYKSHRRQLLRELSTQSDAALKEQLDFLASQPPPIDESGVAQEMYHNIRTLDVPTRVKGILDSTSGTTGSVLIRQDLEPVLHALFVRTFPLWEAISKGPSNGLVHAYNQISAPDTGGQGSSLISELGGVTYDHSTFVRTTTPISVFAQGRGVGIKEEAAVRQGGVDYKPLSVEMSSAMTRLASDIQWQMFQGNFTNSSGQTASTEGGAYNNLGFDGLRGVTGSVGSFSSNSAVQVDVGSLNITESLKLVAAKEANNGGFPDLAVLGMLAKDALDTEQMPNQRWNDNVTEIVPGVSVTSVNWANGKLKILPVPGSTLGTYNRTSDSALVEDMYVFDSSKIMLRWLYSETMTVLEIPSGVDGQLSNRVICFFMYGLEQAAPPFSGKARRLAS